jgi:hypothetical protein
MASRKTPKKEMSEKSNGCPGQHYFVGKVVMCMRIMCGEIPYSETLCIWCLDFKSTFYIGIEKSMY